MIPEGYTVCDLDDAEKLVITGSVRGFIKVTERGHGDLYESYYVGMPEMEVLRLSGFDVRYTIERYPDMMIPIRKIKDSEPEPEPYEVSAESAIATEMVKEYMKIFQGFGGKK